MGHYTGDRILTIASIWNNCTCFFAVKILPQGGRRYDQARFIIMILFRESAYLDIPVINVLMSPILGRLGYKRYFEIGQLPYWAGCEILKYYSTTLVFMITIFEDYRLLGFSKNHALTNQSCINIFI